MWGGRGQRVAQLILGTGPTLILLARTRFPDTGDHVLSHPLRQKIMAALEARPFMTMSEIRASAGLGWGNGYHHLKTLERAGLIRRERIGRRLLIRATSTVIDEAEAKARAYLKSVPAAAICADIAAHPGTDVAGIAERTKITERSIYYRVRKLSELGLTVSRSRSRQFALYALPLYEKIAGK